MDELSKFMMECHAVRTKRVAEIANIRQRAKSTGLPLAKLRLAAEAADVDIVADGKELKVVPLF